MTIKFLGTGTSQGIPVIGCECITCTSSDLKNKRLRSSIFLEINNTKILIDTGPDLRQQLLINNITDVDAILLTHEHNDHTAGLDDIRPINFKHKKIIPVYSIPRVLENIRSRFSYAFGQDPYPGSPKLETIPVEPAVEFHIKNISVLPLEYDHGNLKIIGFRILNLAYITDVSHLPEDIWQYFENLEVLIISALQKTEHHAHFSLDQALEAATKIDANKTYLIHMSHTMGPCEEWTKNLPINVFAAFDGLEIKI